MAHTWWHVWDDIETRSDRGLAKEPNKPIGTGYVEAKRKFIQNIPVVGDYAKMVERNQKFKQQLYQKREEEGGLGNWLLNRYTDIGTVGGQVLASPITVPSKLLNVHPEVSSDIVTAVLLGRGTAKGVRAVAKNPRAMDVVNRYNPMSPASKKVVDVKAQTIHGKPIPAETSASVLKKGSMFGKGSISESKAIEQWRFNRAMEGDPTAGVLAYSGTGERISPKTGQPSPYVYQDGSKFLPGQKISDSLSLRTQISSQFLDLLADQKARGITEHSKGAALKEFQKLRGNIAVETAKGDAQRVNNLTKAVRLMEKGETNPTVIANVIQFGAKDSKSQAEGILARQPPDKKETYAYLEARYPQLSPAQVEEIEIIHTSTAKSGFAQVQEVARQLSLSPKDWLKEYLTGKKIAKVDREIIEEMLMDAGHFMAAKSLVEHPEYARLAKLLKSKGVNIDKLARRATTGETAWPEKRLGPEGNIAGKNKPEHEMNIHLAKLMGIPTNWAESIDFTVDRYLGINKMRSWKEIYSRDQLVKAMQLRHDADADSAKAYFNKEITPMTNYEQLSESIDMWANKYGISQRGERTMMYESDFPYARDTYTPVKDEGGAMTKAEAKAFDREMAEKRRKKKK